MFIDEIRIHVRSGDGGRGCVSFRREIYVPRGGPDGGDGGDGGSVYFEVSPHLSTFSHLHNLKKYAAKRGEHGRGSGEHGARGENLVVPIPAGTLVYREDTGALLADLVEINSRFLVARGGRHGRGNARFATSINRAPRHAEGGHPGESLTLRLELKLLADVGLVGFPNAGKSTLISRISKAHPKIADYPFTTLSPHLGAVHLDKWRSFVVADIPGIIEGAHEGAGLGIEFLRHIERTAVLVHLVDVSGTGRNPVKDAAVIDEELESFGHGLGQKPQIVAASKLDALDKKTSLTALRHYAKKKKREFFAFSAVTGEGLKELLNAMATHVERAKENVRRAESEKEGKAVFL